MRHRALGRVIGLVLSCVALASVARAAAPDLTEAPRFVVPGGVEGVDRLSLAESIYDVEVSGVVAHARLEQTYVNEGPSALDAIYVFPMSTRAAITGLVMRVGAREIVATIREREAARADFEAARAQGLTASLLEQERPNVFRMSVANVRPGEVVEVALEWVEQVVPTEGYHELVIPAAVAPRYEGAADLPWTLAADGPGFTDPDNLLSPWDVTVRIAAGVPLGWVGSPSHAIVKSVDEDGATVGLRDAGARGDADFVLRWASDGDEVAAGALRYDAPDGESYVLALIEPPERFEPDDVAPREVVFIVDVSGSMSGFPADTARRLVADVLAELGPRDRFDILTFAGGSEVFSPRSVAATPATARAALAFLDAAGTGGGTELLPALDRAFALPRTPGMARAFVVVTDGFISVEAEAFERVRAAMGEASLFAFGVGTGVNRHLIEGLARVGRGAPFVVDHEGHAREVAEDFATYLRSPLLTGVRVGAEGVELVDVEPSSVPDVHAARPIAVIARLRGDARGARLTLTGTTPAGPWRKTIALDAAPSSPRHAALRTLWARERIARLSDFDRVDANKAEVTRLGLTYGLMTAHTSFVAIDDGRPIAGAPPSQPAVVGDIGALGGMGFSGSGGGGSGMGFIGGGGAAPLTGMANIDTGSGPGTLGGEAPYKARIESKPPTVEVQLGRVTATGADVNALAPHIKRRLAAFRGCLRDGAWAGKVSATLLAGLDGVVQRATIHAKGLADAPRQCLERVARRVRLPVAAGPVSVSFDFVVSRPSPSSGR